MSYSSWHRSTGFTFAVVVSAACSGQVELRDEPAATRQEAVIGSVPQRIWANNYDRAYDSSPDVNYGAYVTQCDRGDGVDIDRSDNSEVPCSIGWTSPGEWLEYDIDSPQAQTIDITARVASDLADRHFHISIDDVNLGDRVLPDTGSWVYENVTYSTVALSAGHHRLRFTFDSDSIDLNYLDLLSAASNTLHIETRLRAVGAVASSVEYPIFPATLAIDDDPSTRWSSQFSDPQWIYVDLGAPRAVSRVVLSWETAASKSFEIGVSQASEGPWTVVAGAPSGDGGSDEFSFPPVVARYVRVYSTARTTQWGNSLYDFSVFGDPPRFCTNGEAPVFPRPPLVVPPIPQSEPSSGPPTPQPVLTPSFVPPTLDPDQCLFNCFNAAALNGDTFVTTGALNSVVYVFVRDAEGDWALQARLRNPEVPIAEPDLPTSRDRTFGASLALLGDELLISGTADGIGKLYVFRRSNDVWSAVQTLTVNVVSLALDARAALVGTGQDAREFRKAGNGAYRLQTIFSAPADLSGRFGNTLALAGEIALVGAPTTRGTLGAGVAYVYERCGSSFRLLQALSADDGSLGSGFAASLALSRGQIAIGVPGAEGSDSTRPGAVELYSRQGEYFRPRALIGNAIPQDGQFRAFGTTLDLQGGRLLVGYSTSYPYAPPSYSLLFDVRAAPTFSAALAAGDPRSVQLSDGRALVNVSGLRYGTIPSVFELAAPRTSGSR